jgi:hypothetical protein
MKNLIAINLMVLVVIILSSITANAGIVKVNEDLLINRPGSCQQNFVLCE